MSSAIPGTVSRGTMRNEDLLRAFADELESLSDEAVPSVVAEAREYASSEPYSDAAWEVLATLEDYLQDHAPEGHYFGAHVGDGSDFGFWPDEE